MKDKFKELFEKLKKPSRLTLVISSVLTVVCIAAAMLMLLVPYEGTALEVLAYLSFALAAATLAYTVYVIVLFAPRIRGAVIRRIESNRITRTLKNDYIIRTVTTSTIGFLMSVVMGIFYGVMGIVYLSIWYGALAAYHILIAFVRGGTVRVHVITSGVDDSARRDLRRLKSFGNTGIAMLVLNAALSSAIGQMIFDDRHFSYPDWTVIAQAAYAFYKITMAIINFVKGRRQDAYTVRALRNIGLVDAAVSILALQTALLHTYTDGTLNISWFNTGTGIVVSAMAITLSIFMIVEAKKSIAKIKAEKTVDG